MTATSVTTSRASNASPIRTALAKWPRGRFDDFDAFASYWERVFQDYDQAGVADAIDAVRMHSDPYLPTCDAVFPMLQAFGKRPEREGFEVAETRRRIHAERMAAARALRERRAIDHEIRAAPPTLVTAVAEQVLHDQPPDLVAMMRRRGLEKSRPWRGLVATALRTQATGIRQNQPQHVGQHAS